MQSCEADALDIQHSPVVVFAKLLELQEGEAVGAQPGLCAGLRNALNAIGELFEFRAILIANTMDEESRNRKSIRLRDSFLKVLVFRVVVN
jgi:hypothetical protein